MLSTGGGDSALVEYLWRTQLSRRKLLLNELFGEIERNAELLGGLPSCALALQALKAAQTADLVEVDRLLLHPQVGGWIAYTLRRRRGGTTSEDTAPLWVDFGAVHTLCLMAAARTRLAWQTRLPHRDGRVTLFGRGMALFTGLAVDDTIEAATAAGRITLRAGTTTIDVSAEFDDDDEADSQHWWKLRQLRVGGDRPIEFCLDDLDAFRDLADPVPPKRVSEANVVIWQQLLDGAWELLCDHHPEAAEAIADGVVSLVPLPLGDGRETRSASSAEAFGSVMVTQPPDAVTLACSLVHEFQHIKLGGLMHLVRLAESDDSARYYAPWRDDPRPLSGLLQGVYAFFGIAAFWRRQRQTVSDAADRLTAEFEYTYARAQTHEALGIALGSGGLTSAGRRFTEALLGQLEHWLSDELDPAAVRAARLVADHHRTGWRMRHQRASTQEVDALLEAWHHERPAMVTLTPAGISPASAVRWSQGMVGLVRRHILMPQTWQTFDGPDGNWWREAVSEGDIALVDGQTDVARVLFAEAVQAEPEDPDAWSGLALTLRTTDRIEGDSAADHALRWRPELVRELYTRLNRDDYVKDPVHVAEWLGRAMASA